MNNTIMVTTSAVIINGTRISLLPAPKHIGMKNNIIQPATPPLLEDAGNDPMTNSIAAIKTIRKPIIINSKPILQKPLVKAKHPFYKLLVYSIVEIILLLKQ
jgi:hypothetical protein